MTSPYGEHLVQLEGQDDLPGASSTPDPNTDANAALTSSTSDTSQTQTAPSSGDTDVKTPSSGAEGEPKRDLLSVVEDVLKASKSPEETTKTEAKTPDPVTPDGEVKDTTPDPTDVPDAEMSKYSANAQKRIKGLIDETKRLRREIEASNPVIEDYTKMTTFMRENDLQAEHVSSLMTFGAALRRGDFVNAKEIVEPYYFAIKEALGEKLADDVQRQYDDGIIDESAARELTRLRAEKTRLETTVNEVVQGRQQAAASQAVAQIHASVADWEKSVRARDPDYAAKAGLIEDAARAVLLEKGRRPASPQEAIQYAQEAYERVNRSTAKFRNPQPTRPTPQTGSNVSTPVAARPKSLMEAVDIGLAQSRSGL